MAARPPAQPPFVGILGGMGPLAGIDFAEKLVDAATQVYRAERDQDQVPFVLWSVPQVPDRVGPLLTGEGESPLPEMQRGIAALNALGVDVIAIACNTAHAWHADLAAQSRAPILHVADAVVAHLSGLRGIGKVGIVATPATLHVRLFQEPLERAGYDWLVPEPEEIEKLVKPAIALVKWGAARDAAAPTAEVCDRLAARGADAVVLACTELPIALDAGAERAAGTLVDPARVMALECVRFSRAPNKSL